MSQGVASPRLPEPGVSLGRGSGTHRRRLPRFPPSLGVLISLTVHLSLALVALRLPASPFREPRSIEIALTVTSPDTNTPSTDTQGARANAAAPLTPGGGLSAQNIDALERGAGGDGLGARAILLFPRADELTQQDSILNAVGVAQMQRIRTANDQATREDRRATPNPGDVPFLASGDGAHPERRPVAARDPLDGARTAPQASLAGQDVVRAPSAGGTTIADAHGSLAIPVGAGGAGANGRTPAEATGAATSAGMRDASPGRGIAGGAGERESAAARVANGRPPLDQGPAATSSDWRDLRVRDNHDAELLAARLVQSLADTSEHGGRNVGAGSGGVGGGGPAGSGGGTAEGGRARAFGPGGGAYDSLDTSSSRYERWFLDQVRRVDRALVFPRPRQLAMDQGTSVYRIVVRPDGSLAAPPHLMRSSGFRDLDDAALLAIQRAMPFGRVPDALLGERDSLRVTLPVHFVNPLVQ